MDLITFSSNEQLSAPQESIIVVTHDDSLIPDHGFVQCPLYIQSDFIFFQYSLQMLVKNYWCQCGNMKEQQSLRQKVASKHGISLVKGWEELLSYAVMEMVDEN